MLAAEKTKMGNTVEKESVYLVGFFRLSRCSPKPNIERMHLQGIFKTMEEARARLYFCDEGGWYEGALIEQRYIGNQDTNVVFPPNRVWLFQQDDGQMKEMPEPDGFTGTVNLVG